MQENNEVKVTAIGVFESCPDEKLSQDYYESLNKFILSEAHLQENISTVKFHQKSSKQQGELFVHLVKVELTVKTAQLCEPPSSYIRKHLAKNDWLKGNKTRITLENIQ